MTEINLETLRETQKQLKAVCGELQELQGALFAGDPSVVDRHALVIEQIKELKDRFVEQFDSLSIKLPDGKRLLSDQFEALERFASNNKLAIDDVLSRITVEGGVVAECNFNKMGLRTLSGLEGLVRLRELSVSHNSELTSLKGIPTQAIERIDANWCGFTGDLSELSGADKLKGLHVFANKGLTSLKGTPTQAIEVINAYSCGLTGDLSELSGAEKLKVLFVPHNKGLTSLKGIPTKALEVLDARRCGLTGDLSELSGADKLKVLNVSDNEGLTSLKGIPTKALEELRAYRCGLTGDHTFLSKAPKLFRLSLEYNRNLTLDKSKFNGSVEIDV